MKPSFGFNSDQKVSYIDPTQEKVPYITVTSITFTFML